MARKPKKVSVVSNSKPEAEQLSDRQRRILAIRLVFGKLVTPQDCNLPHQ